MIKVRKENRILDIIETDKAAYLAAGYDVINEKGEVVETATGGKTYTPAEYNAVVAEKEKLEEQVKKLKAELKKLKEGKEPPKEDQPPKDEKPPKE